MKNDKSLERKARRAAKRVYCVVRKSRSKLGPYNKGGYQLIYVSGHPEVAAGENFNLSLKGVINICQALWDGDLSCCRSDPRTI